LKSGQFIKELRSELGRASTWCSFSGGSATISNKDVWPPRGLGPASPSIPTAQNERQMKEMQTKWQDLLRTIS